MDILVTTKSGNKHVKYYNIIHVTMSEKRQFSVPATEERLNNIKIYYYLNKKTQEEVFAEMVDKQIPNYKIEGKPKE